MLSIYAVSIVDMFVHSQLSLLKICIFTSIILPLGSPYLPPQDSSRCPPCPGSERLAAALQAGRLAAWLLGYLAW